MTDFSKVFDSVDHSLLISQILWLNIGNPLLSWHNSYTSDKMRYIKINNTQSNLVLVMFGVPQDGYLSPILFCLVV